jgi:hypothetical protein
MGQCLECHHPHSNHASNLKCCHIYAFPGTCPKKTVTKYRPIFGESKDNTNSEKYRMTSVTNRVPITKTRTIYTRILTSRWVPRGYNNSGGYYVQDERIEPKTETYTDYVNETSYGSESYRSNKCSKPREIIDYEKYIVEEPDYSKPVYS